MSDMDGWMGSVHPYVSGDGRDPEVLRKLYEQQKRYEAERPEREAREKAERERIASARREKVDQLLLQGEEAQKYPVKVGTDVFECPVLDTEVEYAEWALIGEQCFPVKWKSGIFVLDSTRRVLALQNLIEGFYGKRGYHFCKWEISARITLSQKGEIYAIFV